MGLSKRIPILMLRLLALGGSVTAALIMVTSRDSTRIFNIKIEAKYTNSPTFKYFVLMNAVASVYTFILLFFPLKSSYRHLILALDLIMTLLLDSSVSACIAIGQVGKKGNSYAGWLPICGQIPRFCDHMSGALIAGFVAVIIYFIILLYSLHKFINLFTLKN